MCEGMSCYSYEGRDIFSNLCKVTCYICRRHDDRQHEQIGGRCDNICGRRGRPITSVHGMGDLLRLWVGGVLGGWLYCSLLPLPGEGPMALVALVWRAESEWVLQHNTMICISHIPHRYWGSNTCPLTFWDWQYTQADDIHLTATTKPVT